MIPTTVKGVVFLHLPLFYYSYDSVVFLHLLLFYDFYDSKKCGLLASTFVLWFRRQQNAWSSCIYFCFMIPTTQKPWSSCIYSCFMIYYHVTVLWMCTFKWISRVSEPCQLNSYTRKHTVL
jgi:hypothetical protein